MVACLCVRRLLLLAGDQGFRVSESTATIWIAASARMLIGFEENTAECCGAVVSTIL